MAKKKAITAAPTGKVTELTVTRNGNKFDAKWEHPDNYNSDDNEKRIEWYNMEWHFDAYPRPKKGWPLEHEYGPKYTKGPNPYPAKVSSNTSTVMKEEYYGITKESSQTINPKIYYPYKKNYLEKVYIKVISGNSKGEGAVQTSAYYTFKKPKNPQMGGMSYNSSTGRLSSTVKVDAGNNAYARTDTMYRITRKDNLPSKTYKKEKTVKAWYRNTGTEHTVSINMGDQKRLTYGQWILIKFQCYSRGLRGKSSTMTKKWIFCHPSKPAISSVDKMGDFSSGYAVINVKVRANSKESKNAEYWRVTSCKLQVATTTSDLSKTEAQQSLSFQDVDGAVDDANVKGFEQPLADLNLYDNGVPKGLHVWYRVVNSNQDYTQYSDPFEAKKLYLEAPDASDDQCTILQLLSQDRGQTVRAIVGHKNDDSNSVVLEWSTYANAPTSNQPPESMTADWGSKSGDNRIIKNDTWPYEKVMYARGLDADVKYYFWARRMDTSSGVMGPRCSKQSITLEVPPENVELSIPAYLVKGKSMRASWTFDSEKEQKKWRIERDNSEDSTPNWVTLASGDDALGSASIAASVLSDKFTSAKLRVCVSTGGSFVASPAVEVNVLSEPTCSLTVPETVTDQPVTMVVSTDSASAYVIVKIFSYMGVSEQPDETTIVQEEGVCIWSSKVDPSWSEGTATIVADSGIALIDGSSYYVTATVVDKTTGLSSEEQQKDFTVNWTNKPVPPGNKTRVVGSQTDMTATIYLVAGEGGRDTDVADIYRVTPDKMSLIASNVSFGKTVKDRYAPYAKQASLYYRVVTRTIDGAMKWVDVPYGLYGHVTRFDWGDGRSLELPFNLSLSTSRSKDSELRSHLDGSINGVWNPAISRKLSLSSDLIRLGNAEEKRLLAEMGSYPGPVFVRTREGAAFLADVQVSSIEDTYDSLVTPVKIDASEIDLTPAFMVRTEDIEASQYEAPIEPQVSIIGIVYEGEDAPQEGSEYTYGDIVEEGFKIFVAASDDGFQDMIEVPATVEYEEVTHTDSETESEWTEYLNVITLGEIPTALSEKITALAEYVDDDGNPATYRVILA